MKAIKILSVLILLSINIYSQNNEPHQYMFSFDAGIFSDTPYIGYLNSNMSYFQQNNFLLGWQWSGGACMSFALLDNQAHTSVWSSSKKFSYNANYLILNQGELWCSHQGKQYLQSQSIRYSPTLKVIGNDPVKFQPKANDTTNPIFGFKYIDTLLNINNPELTLLKNSDYVGNIILKDPWMNDAFEFNSQIQNK